MRAGKYSYQGLFVNRYVEQLVIPEIQRDYVWEEEQVLGLVSSILDDFNKFENAVVPAISSTNEDIELVQLKDDFSEFYKKRNHSSNIGFIYAYCDPQYEGRYFLIDGQQRVTTIFLLMLLLASRTTNKLNFKKHYCNGGLPKLDYRIRDAAHSFLHQLVPFVLDNSIKEIENQRWYLSGYSNDLTISHMIKNITTLEIWLDNSNLNESEFYDYLNNYTEFWYFDTNLSTQGENLYIYLNARGEQMQINENLKADLLSCSDSIDDKNSKGLLWEEWQDFFWKNRYFGHASKNKNDLSADQGFNEFLNCITGLEAYLKSSSDSLNIMHEPLTFEVIAAYIEALKYIDANKNILAESYEYTDWIGVFLIEFWTVLNANETNWLSDYRDNNKSTERNRMVFIWGVLHWVNSSIKSAKSFSVVDVYKGIRAFYLRYKNNIRSVVGKNSVKRSVENLLENGFSSLEATTEEYNKERWLREVNDLPNYHQIESLLWELEDHPYNINGSDVGAKNSSHLIDYDSTLTLEKLKKRKDTFYACFPPEKAKDDANFPVLQSLLLHYGDFYRKRKPDYYENYQFNAWRSIIRSVELRHCFLTFLNELMEINYDANELLARKRALYNLTKGTQLREHLLWYNFHIKESMWLQGGFIALTQDYSDTDNDDNFPDRRNFFNTKGNFKGSSHRELAKMLTS